MVRSGSKAGLEMLLLGMVFLAQAFSPNVRSAPSASALDTAPPAPPPKTAGAGTARIAHYGHAEITVEVDAPAGGFLVLTDIWHPWWRALIDGEPAPMLKADVLFRAVQLAPGRHEVRFEFHPLSGALAALAALAAKLAVYFPITAASR